MRMKFAVLALGGRWIPPFGPGEDSGRTEVDTERLIRYEIVSGQTLCTSLA